MRRYNIMNPILILAVAFLTNSIVKFICSLLGTDPETAESFALGAMIIAAIVTYFRLQRPPKK